MNTTYTRQCMLLFLALCAWRPLLFAQEGKPAMATFEGRPLFEIRTRVGAFSPESRARELTARLMQVATDSRVPTSAVTVAESESSSDVVAGDTILTSVTDADAKAAGLPRQELARRQAETIRAAIREYRSAHGLWNLVRGLLLTVLGSAALVLVYTGLRRLFSRGRRAIRSWRQTRLRAVAIQQVELLSADRIAAILELGLRTAWLAAAVLLVYGYLLLVFSSFPATRDYATALVASVRYALQAVVGPAVAALPNLLIIAIICVAVRYLLKFARFLFEKIEAGAIVIAGFYREWARPTYKITRFLVLVFAAMIAFPYVPGSGSPAFKGVSIFLGVLLSLGSTSAVGNIVAGVILTYTRAFQLGDRVQVADAVGDVVDRSLLATRLRTIKNEDITIPNALVLGSHIKNYSCRARERELILHTSVTIGYDAPWRTVHRLLIDAARSTPRILAEPAPFVLQTALNDFYVSYQINAYTGDASKMVSTYSDLHQNIQDRFNEAGVEICSPHFSALRDANHIAIPGEYVPRDYAAPAFRVRDLAGSQTGPSV
jgi:small-conductance mechanosensitive channel